MSAVRGMQRVVAVCCMFAVLLVVVATNAVSAAAGDVVDLKFAVTGSTFVYKKIIGQKLIGPDTFEQDIKAAVPATTATISDVLFEDSNIALYIRYKATLVDKDATGDSISAAVSKSELTLTNTALKSQATTFLTGNNKKYAEMYPSNVRPYIPLMPVVTTTPAPVYVNTTSSSHTIYFSGAEDKWTKVVSASASVLNAAISNSVVEAVSHNGVDATCTVSLTVWPADATLTKPGDGRGGLKAQVNVTQQLTKNSRHPLNIFEANTAIANMDIKAVSGVYAATAAADGASKTPSAPSTDAVHIVAVVYGEPETKRSLTRLQLSMIIVAAVIVALMLIVLVSFTCIDCCCWDQCCGSRLLSVEDKPRQGASPLHGYMLDEQPQSQMYNHNNDDDGSPSYVYYGQK